MKEVASKKIQDKSIIFLSINNHKLFSFGQKILSHFFHISSCLNTTNVYLQSPNIHFKRLKCFHFKKRKSEKSLRQLSFFTFFSDSLGMQYTFFFFPHKDIYVIFYQYMHTCWSTCLHWAVVQDLDKNHIEINITSLLYIKFSFKNLSILWYSTLNKP